MDPLVTLSIEARAITHKLNSVISPDDMALCVIEELGPIRPTDLTDELGVASPTVSHSIGRLLRQGMIERVGRDENDGRVKAVQITEAGRERVRELEQNLFLLLPGPRQAKVEGSIKSVKRARAALSILWE